MLLNYKSMCLKYKFDLKRKNRACAGQSHVAYITLGSRESANEMLITGERRVQLH